MSIWHIKYLLNIHSVQLCNDTQSVWWEGDILCIDWTCRQRNWVQVSPRPWGFTLQRYSTSPRVHNSFKECCHRIKPSSLLTYYGVFSGWVLVCVDCEVFKQEPLCCLNCSVTWSWETSLRPQTGLNWLWWCPQILKMWELTNHNENKHVSLNCRMKNKLIWQSFTLFPFWCFPRMKRCLSWRLSFTDVLTEKSELVFYRELMTEIG